jgi:4,5-dihydroxyphthalate decarboxylase
MRIQGNNQALVDGTVAPQGFALDLADVPQLTDGFRRMVRDLEFDVSEMPFATYLCAREHDVPLTALPIFLVRGFHHGAIVHNVHSEVEVPRDLEGREVGVNRGYTVTTGVWARGILEEEYGVDLRRVRWLRSGGEHVAGYAPPRNVGDIPEGKSLPQMLTNGELPAAVNVSVDRPDVKPLIPDHERASLEALRRDGLYPINHLIVVSDELLDEYAGLATALFEAFAEAKAPYVRRLRHGEIADLTDADRAYAQVIDILGDPLPYGVEPNRAMIETLIRHATSQGIVATSVEPEEIFAEETRDLLA